MRPTRLISIIAPPAGRWGPEAWGRLPGITRPFPTITSEASTVTALNANGGADNWATGTS